MLVNTVFYKAVSWIIAPVLFNLGGEKRTAWHVELLHILAISSFSEHGFVTVRASQHCLHLFAPLFGCVLTFKCMVVQKDLRDELLLLGLDWNNVISLFSKMIHNQKVPSSHLHPWLPQPPNLLSFLSFKADLLNRWNKQLCHDSGSLHIPLESGGEEENPGRLRESNEIVTPRIGEA